VPSIEERAERVLEQARVLAGRVTPAAEFSHAVFNPQDGLAVRTFPTLRERREFTMTKPYAEIYDILRRLMARSVAAPESRAQSSHVDSVRRRQTADADGRERSP
jgi:hypothetical protein